MASQDSSPTPPSPQPLLSHLSQQQPLHHQQQQLHHQQQQHPQTILMGPPQQSDDVTSYQNNLMPYQHPQQTHTQPPPHFPFNPVVTDGGAGEDSSSPPLTDGSVAGFSIESAKKKRGRPRKSPVDGEGASGVALGPSPTPLTPGKSPAGVAVTDSSGGGGGAEKSEKRRGRPPGSMKKQIDSLGSSGMGFTPHVIIVNAGEDVASKIVEFTQQGPRTVCILSANGTISNVTLRLPGSSGRTVTYEGRFEIISLLGSFLVSESTGGLRVGGLSVSLAGADGRVLGGGVAGRLIAATPVQVIVGSFMIQDVKKPKLMPIASPSSIASAAVASAPNTVSFGDQVTAGVSPPSEGGASSNLSDDDNNSDTNNGGGSFDNAGQPMQDIAMYDWGNS